MAENILQSLIEFQRVIDQETSRREKRWLAQKIKLEQEIKDIQVLLDAETKL